MNYKNQRVSRTPLVLFALLSLLVPSGASMVKAQDANTTYRGTGRDPFKKYKPPPPRKIKPVVVKKAPTPIEPPSVQERVNAYKAQKAAAMSAQLPAPKPTTALLLSELQVVGVFRTPRGYTAMVEATPIKLSYVIYPGEKFYDGQLVAIEENRLVFRRETRWTDGRREMAVETKPLRSANAVTDSMTATKQTSTSVAPAESTRSANRPASATSNH